MLFLILLHIDCPVEGPVSPRNFQKLAPHFHFSLLPLGELSPPLDSVFSCQVPPNHFHHVLEGPVPPRDFQELAPHFLFSFLVCFQDFQFVFYCYSIGPDLTTEGTSLPKRFPDTGTQLLETMSSPRKRWGQSPQVISKDWPTILNLFLIVSIMFRFIMFSSLIILFIVLQLKLRQVHRDHCNTLETFPNCMRFCFLFLLLSICGQSVLLQHV